MSSLAVVFVTFIMLPALAVAGEPLPLATQIVQQAKQECNSLDNGIT